MLKTPILLITFNRPDHVRQVLTEIRKQQPAQLFICQDGAREGNALDAERVQEVRNVVNELVDWPCELHTLYQEKNLGCGPGPAAGITWFFEHVEMGIILEDDCLPHHDFFVYCEELLDRYKDDERVAIIGGCNYKISKNSNHSYSFVGGHHQTWGWATWKRTWSLFDYYLAQWDKKMFSRVIKHYYKDPKQQIYWETIFSMVKNDRMGESCWDYQFYFSYWEKQQLAICPSVNLVSNIGFGNEATHTTAENNDMLNCTTAAILPLVHPKEIVHDKSVDNYMMSKYIIPYEYGWSGIKRIPYRINKYVKKIFNHEGPWIKRNK